MAHLVTPTNERIDVPKAKNRLLVRVDCSTSGQVICGVLLQPGSNDIVVYEDELRRLEAMAEDQPHRIKDAEQAYENAYKRWVEDKSPGAYDRAQRGAPVPDRLTREVFGGSVEAEFRKLVGRSILPLRNVEILAELPRPGQAARENAGGAVGPWDVVSAIDEAALKAAEQALSQSQGGKSSKGKGVRG